MNVEIGAEAALFPEKEYINRIFVSVQGAVTGSSRFIRLTGHGRTEQESIPRGGWAHNSGKQKDIGQYL